MAEAIESLIVEKSKDLVWAKFKDYSATELRLLEVYLSKINARNPDSAMVRLTLKEYANIVGVTRIQKSAIDSQLNHFLGNVVTLTKAGSTEVEKYTLFTCAKYDVGSESSVSSEDEGYISICCNEKIKHVFFELANTGYVKYRLKYTAQMKSQYAIQLYSIFLDVEHLKPWTIGVEKLKDQIGANKDYCKEFYRFNGKVLKPAIEEINELTDLNITYTPVHGSGSGRGVKYLEFLIRKKPNADRGIPESLLGWFSNAADGKLALPQVKKLTERIRELVLKAVPGLEGETMENAVYDTLRNLYLDAVRQRTDREPIYNLGGYLWAILEDAGSVEQYLPAAYVTGFADETPEWYDRGEKET